MQTIKKKRFELISWVTLVLLSIALYFTATDFFMFPTRFKIPLLLGLSLIICITGIFAILARKRGKIVSKTLSVVRT
jgi:uncharacterized membrane protein